MSDVILELVTKIELECMTKWLTTDITHKDLEEIVKNEATSFKDIFPFLLLDFIKIQTSRILKWNNVAPTEISSATPSPKREPLVVHDLFSTPSPKNIKNFTSPVEIRNVRRITPQQQQHQHRTIDLQSETAFPSLQSPGQTINKETPKKRRINPTQLLSDVQSTPTKSPVQFGSCAKSNPPSPATGNPFNQAREQTNGHKSLDQERALLKEHKKMVKSPSVSSVVLDLSANVSNKSWSCLEPELTSVTHKVLLDRLAAILSFCLSNHLIPSIYSEIKFLIELVVIRVSPARYTPSTDDAVALLNNVHNCVYFAAKCLELLFDSVWSYIDRCLLQQLISNPRLMQFSPDFISKLSRLASSTLGEGSRRSSAHRTVANVPFQTDTDNRLNFASDSSFQYFRKQRDQFCEVWQIWKSNHANPGWNMAVALQRMIQNLVNLKQDVVNYVHLARLFRSQLLNVAQLVEVVQDEGPLSQLQSSDPDKLRRLRERLTESRARSSSSPGAVHFEGDQEFFRDFIHLAANPAFNEHLKNCLVSGIEQGSRAEDCDEADRFAETVISLKVQAKFIAFLTFHPHMSNDHLPEHVFHQLSRLRSAEQPPIDLFFYTDNAFRFGRLVLTVPWIVTYLSLADPVSLSLATCHPVLCYVVYIYRRADRFGSPSNAFFVRILLSWLLEQVNLPRSLLTKTDAELMKEIQKKRTQLYSMHPVDGSSTSTAGRLDELIVVESTLIYQCCPFLWTWKHLLTNFACSDARSSSDGRSLTSRKITPISAEENNAVTAKGFAGVKSLQASLEENFFHNQPSSVKRTVDFVAERVASNIVRDIRHQIIPQVSLDAQAVATAASSDDGRPRTNDDSICKRLCESVKLQAAERISSVSISLEATLGVLLPNDLLPTVKQVCCAVASRLANEKVTEWLQLHVTISFFRNEMMREADKLDKVSAKRSTAGTESLTLTLSNPATVHDALTWPPSFLIDHLKKQVREIIQDEGAGLCSADLNNLLSRCDGTLHRRLDLTPVVFKCLQQLTFDLIFVLCVFQPENILSNDIRSWVEFWKRSFSIETITVSESSSSSSSSSSSLWIVFAPRQLLMLAQSTSARQSWNHVSTLVLQLLKNGLLSYKDVQEQCLSVVRQDWPQELLGRFATCIRDIVDWQQSEQASGNGGGSDDPRDHSDDNDGRLLDWLSWFCSQDDLL